MICVWQKLGNEFSCVHCGTVRPKEVNRICHKPCPYLGPPIPSDLVIIKSLCPSCGGEHKWKQTANQVHECAEKGRCLPTYRCGKTALVEERVSGEWAQPCVTCDLRPGRP